MSYVTISDLKPLLKTMSDPNTGVFIAAPIDAIEQAMREWHAPQRASTSGLGMMSVEVAGERGTLLTTAYPAKMESALAHLDAQRPDLKPVEVR